MQGNYLISSYLDKYYFKIYYVCMDACMHVCTWYVCMDGCMDACIHACIYVCMYLCWPALMFLGTEQPSIPCSNWNSICFPHCIDDVLLDIRELVGGLCTYVEFLFGACRDGDSTKYKKCYSSKCISVNF